MNDDTDLANIERQTGICAEPNCGFEIQSWGGASWTHTKGRGGRNHPAQPDQEPKERAA